MTASTPGAVRMADSAFATQVCHVMPSTLITMRSISAVMRFSAGAKFVMTLGKNSITIAIAVTAQRRTLLNVMAADRILEPYVT